MPIPILATKLFAPSPQANAVSRPRLIEHLNDGLSRRVTVLSAPAGSGKTTLISQWAAASKRPIAWLSLDVGDSDPLTFLAYLAATLQTIVPAIGGQLMQAIQSPQPPSTESLLTALVNELTTVTTPFILVLDDYHVIDSRRVDEALGFIIDYMPVQMHVALATREDPNLPLARLRVRGQLSEVRAAELRFTESETTEFCAERMQLHLTAADIAALDARTEGWIAGLQLAALSMQRHPDQASFIRSFTGSHRYVLDYLVEEVLNRQPPDVQAFLLHTSILDRLTGALCDAVSPAIGTPAQAMLEHLEHANLFIIPLDTERRWYRYHHLFAEILRQRLREALANGALHDGVSLPELHGRASRWFEANGYAIEAFHHAVAAGDLDRTVYLVQGNGVPLFMRGGARPVVAWLQTLPSAFLAERPALLVDYAAALLFISQIEGIEAKLQIAERRLTQLVPDSPTRDLIGHIAVIRATVAVTQHQAETILTQAQRALTYLNPGNVPVRAAITWALGYAYFLNGDIEAARRAYHEAYERCKAIGHLVILLMSTIGLGNTEEADSHLASAAQYYREAVQLAGSPPMPAACEAHLGLARIAYAQNEIATAEQHWQTSIQLARQIEHTDRVAACEIILARLKLARGDAAGAALVLDRTARDVLEQGFSARIPEIAALQVLVLLRQNRLVEAAQVAERQNQPVSLARVRLAERDAFAALAILEQAHRDAMPDRAADRLSLDVLHALALEGAGEHDAALEALDAALAAGEADAVLRPFIDEGLLLPGVGPLLAARLHGPRSGYVARLLAALQTELARGSEGVRHPDSMLAGAVTSALIEPLSRRETEVLQLIAQGLSNQDISATLYVALDTVKGHNRRIFEKLQVQRRTEAVARARSLGIL